MLEIKNLSLSIDARLLLNELNFRVEKNEYFVILGPTGSGKTLLLECIAGFKKHKGEIYYEQENITRKKSEKRNFGLLYQDYALFPHLNVRQNIAFALKLKKVALKEQVEKIEWLCEKLQITHLLDRKINYLSGGEKQKVALARTIIQKPQLLLLDEPLAAIDQSFRRQLYDFFRAIHHEFNLTIIHVTHNFDEAIYLADRICLINKGKIEQIDSPLAVFSKPKTKFSARIIGADNIIPIHIKDKQCYLEGIDIPLSTDCIGKRYAILHSEDVLLSKQQLKSSARFSLTGKVIKIWRNVYLSELKLDIGFEINVKITNVSLKDLNIKVDDQLFVTFKESSLVLI